MSKKNDKQSQTDAAMQRLNKDIREGTFARVYLLCGEEDYLLRFFKRRLRETILKDDTTHMNILCCEEKPSDLREIIEFADTMPFFAERRLVILEDTGYLKSGGEVLAAYLPEMPESTVMILAEKEVDKRSKLYKAIEKEGAVCELNMPSPEYVRKWVLSKLKKEKKEISELTLARFLQICGQDMQNMESELEKLLAYTADRTAITQEDLAQICEAAAEDRIFDMVDAILRRDPEKCMEYYAQLKILQISERRILYLLTDRVESLVLIADLKSRGVSDDEIMEKLAIRHRFILDRQLKLLRNVAVGDLIAARGRCLETYTRIQVENMDETVAVEMLMMQCI